VYVFGGMNVYVCVCVSFSALVIRKKNAKLSFWAKCRKGSIQCQVCRVGQNRIYTPYMTVYLMISLPKIPHIHRIYMVLANPTSVVKAVFSQCQVLERKEI